jgi:hypothetical protein
MPGNYGYQNPGAMAPQGYAMQPQGYGMPPQGYGMAPQGYPDPGYAPGGQVQLAQATEPVAEEVQPNGATSVAEDGTVYYGPDGQMVSPEGYEADAVPGYSHAPVFGWQPPPSGTRIRNLLPGPYQGLGAQDGCGPGLFGDKLVARLGHLYVKCDALMLRRSNPGGSLTLVQTQDPVTGAPLNSVLTTGSIQLKNEVGQRFTLGISQTERANIEVTYWSWLNSIGTTGVVGNHNLEIGAPPGFIGNTPPLAGFTNSPFVNASQFTTANSTTIWSAEANYLATSVFDKFIFLGGFRAIQLHDHFSLSAFNQPTASQGVGLFDLPIRNEMYGGQLGFIFRQNFDLLTFEITSKSGCYNDHANMRSYVAGTISGVTRDMSVSSNAAAFVQEFSMNATYSFTSAFAIRLGYQIMWFDNMALATNNIDLTNTATSASTILRGQNLFLYGMNLGLEARF